MLRFATILCATMLLMGCSIVKVSVQKGEEHCGMIVGYGYGKVQKAHNEAWADARKKLEMSGLDKRYGLAENKSEYRARTAVIMFILVPREDAQSAETQSDCDQPHEEDRPRGKEI